MGMKYKEYNGRIIHMSEEVYYRRLIEITSKCKRVDSFCFEGLYFSGSIVGTTKAYLQENPNKGFFEWLIDNGLEIKQQ